VGTDLLKARAQRDVLLAQLKAKSAKVNA
jgi:hypothetical protein